MSIKGQRKEKALLGSEVEQMSWPEKCKHEPDTKNCALTTTSQSVFGTISVK